MKKIIVAMSILSTLCSCFNINITPGGKAVRCKGPVVEKTMDLKDFNAIVVNGHSDLILKQADTFSVVVTANEDVFEHLDYRVEDGVLILGAKDNVTLLAKKHELAISLPVITSLSVNGAADVDLKGYKSDKPMIISLNGAGDFELSGIAVPELDFTMNGAGDIDALDLDVKEINVTMNGAGDITLSGKAKKTVISVHGAGDVDASELDCDVVVKHCAGLASIKTKK